MDSLAIFVHKVNQLGNVYLFADKRTKRARAVQKELRFLLAHASDAELQALAINRSQAGEGSYDACLRQLEQTRALFLKKTH